MQREELAYGHMSFASRDPVFVGLDLRRTGGSSGEKRPFCDILSQLKPTLMHSSALEPPCDARSDELDQKIPAVRRPSKKPLE